MEWFVLGVSTGLIAAGAAVVAAGVLTDPHGGYQPRHLAGRNPAADDLERALSESRRRLRRSPAPWAPPKKRHVTESPRSIP